MPNTITKIGQYAFRGCTSLKELTFSNKLTTIDQGAFKHCESLTIIDLPESVYYIGSDAFSNCTNLKKVIIRSDYIIFMVNPFGQHNDNLEFVVVSNGIEHSMNWDSFYEKHVHKNSFQRNPKTLSVSSYNRPSQERTNTIKKESPKKSSTSSTTPKKKKVDSVFVNMEFVDYINDNNSLIITPGERSKVASSFDITSDMAEQGHKYSVVRIKPNAFQGNSNLRIVVIPDSIKVIEKFTFKDCSSLKQVTIPSSVEKIENNAFDGCKSLEEITLPESIQEIQTKAFANCSSLVKIHIPGQVTQIHEHTFFNCEKLNEVHFPDSLLVIKQNAFTNCTSLTKVFLPHPLKRVKKYSNEPEIKIINVSNKKTKIFIEENAFDSNTKITFHKKSKKSAFSNDMPTVEYEIVDNFAMEKILKSKNSVNYIQLPQKSNHRKEQTYQFSIPDLSILKGKKRTFYRNVYWIFPSIVGEEQSRPIKILCYECLKKRKYSNNKHIKIKIAMGAKRKQDINPSRPLKKKVSFTIHKPYTY